MKGGFEPPPSETGAKRGRLRGEVVVLGHLGEPGVPAVEVLGEVVVEDPGADLEKQVRAARGASHLLFLDHAFADDLVDGRLGELGGDGLASAVTLP